MTFVFNRIGDYAQAGADPALAFELFQLPFSDDEHEAVTNALVAQNGQQQ